MVRSRGSRTGFGLQPRPLLALKLLLPLLVITASASAQTPPSIMAQPQLINGKLQPTPLPGGLTRAALDRFATTAGTAWLGYAVPAEKGVGCWHESWSQGQRVVSQEGPRVVALEGSSTAHVLYRLDSGRIDRIRVSGGDCTLDTGGLVLHWSNDVTPAASVALLATFLTGDVPNRQIDGALTALAMHRETSALDRLLATARVGATTHLRGQALFWLGQRAGDRAVGAINEAIEQDPETEVKRRAVFALSQLPKDEGVPLLIQVARTNTNPAVRKQAMFWLGQSKDARAIAFFETILFPRK